MTQCAISSNHEEEGENAYSGGLLLFSLALKLAPSEQSLPILFVVMTNVKLPGQH